MSAHSVVKLGGVYEPLTCSPPVKIIMNVLVTRLLAKQMHYLNPLELSNIFLYWTQKTTIISLLILLWVYSQKLLSTNSPRLAILESSQWHS